MDKQELSNQIAAWLKIFLLVKFSKTHDVLEVLIPESNLSKLPN